MSTQLNPAMLRAYIRDTPAMNKVFPGVEFEDKDYESAVYWGKEKVGGIPPFIENFSYSEIPLDTQRIGALAALFEMAALLAIRNKSNLSEQGIPVPVGANAEYYERLADKYEGIFFKKVHTFKVAVNVTNSFNYQKGVYADLDGGGDLEDF